MKLRFVLLPIFLTLIGVIPLPRLSGFPMMEEGAKSPPESNHTRRDNNQRSNDRTTLQEIKNQQNGEEITTTAQENIQLIEESDNEGSDYDSALEEIDLTNQQDIEKLTTTIQKNIEKIELLLKQEDEYRRCYPLFSFSSDFSELLLKAKDCYDQVSDSLKLPALSNQKGNESEKQHREILEKNIIKFWANSSYDPNKLEYDKYILSSYYRSLGYADFNIISVNPQMSKCKDYFDIIYVVEEGVKYTFRKIEIENNIIEIDENVLKKLVSIYPGNTYNHDRINNISYEISNKFYSYFDSIY
jgi:hypothetical protein